MTPEERLKKATLLIVEDEPEAAEAMATIVRSLVGRVIRAANGAEGLKMVHRENPDMILSDMEMPVMTGMEMVRHLRAEGRRLPILAVTIYHDAYHRSEGVDKVIFKPIERDELRASLVELAQKLSENIK